jgi:N-acetylglucosamine-6-sulfatase
MAALLLAHGLPGGRMVGGGTTVRAPTHKSVHTQGRIFVEYDTGKRELYDLGADPYQLRSLPRAGNEQTNTNLGNRLAKLRACAGATCRTAEGP